MGVLLASVAGSSPAAAQTSTGVATVTATFAPRTAFRAAASSLEFHVITPDQPAMASVDFVASARTWAGAEVRLLVEPAGAVSGPGGAADVETRLVLESGGDGVVPGDVPLSGRSTAARWTGSGRRSGRLVFSLRASAPGRYAIPLTFLVSVP